MILSISLSVIYKKSLPARRPRKLFFHPTNVEVPEPITGKFDRIYHMIPCTLLGTTKCFFPFSLFFCQQICRTLLFVFVFFLLLFWRNFMRQIKRGFQFQFCGDDAPRKFDWFNLDFCFFLLRENVVENLSRENDVIKTEFILFLYCNRISIRMKFVSNSWGTQNLLKLGSCNWRSRWLRQRSWLISSECHVILHFQIYPTPT